MTDHNDAIKRAAQKIDYLNDRLDVETWAHELDTILRDLVDEVEAHGVQANVARMMDESEGRACVEVVELRACLARIVERCEAALNREGAVSVYEELTDILAIAREGGEQEKQEGSATSEPALDAPAAPDLRELRNMIDRAVRTDDPTLRIHYIQRAQGLLDRIEGGSDDK